jgi:hypothetical protein
MGVSTTFVQPISISMPQVSRTQIEIFAIFRTTVETSYPQTSTFTSGQFEQRADLKHAKKSHIKAESTI